jgi:alkylated DNA nucleotide flippase Atl1
MMRTFERVWELVTHVPRGFVVTYGDVAQALGGWTLGSLGENRRERVTPQLVGWALHANKREEVPCHRVVNRFGRVADAFAFDGWREQRRRLEAEGVTFVDEKTVSLEKHRYQFDESFIKRA